MTKRTAVEDIDMNDLRFRQAQCKILFPCADNAAQSKEQSMTRFELHLGPGGGVGACIVSGSQTRYKLFRLDQKVQEPTNLKNLAIEIDKSRGTLHSFCAGEKETRLKRRIRG